jgi:hypothetical protein
MRAGSTADAILEAAIACGAVIAESDLRLRGRMADPDRGVLSGHRILECAPNGKGLTAFVALSGKLPSCIVAMEACCGYPSAGYSQLLGARFA